MNILGINAYHADASACLIADGKLVAAVEEERFVRIKHCAGFPKESIRFCLKSGGIKPKDLDLVAVANRPSSHWPQRLGAALRLGVTAPEFQERLKLRFRRPGLKDELATALDVSVDDLSSVRFSAVEHHRAHLASSYYVSGTESSAVLSLDGLGDFVSAMWGQGQGTRLRIQGRVFFPHSLGFLYTALTQYLGFLHWGDEYKVMGLAAYGKPEYLSVLRELVFLGRGLNYRLHPDEFAPFHEWVPMQWGSGAPASGLIFTQALEKRLGPRRKQEEPLTDRHADIAASLQAILEEIVLEMLRRLSMRTHQTQLCYAGGVALNCVLNGKIFSQTPFRDIFIQPAAYDAGNAIGAAYYVYHHELGRPRSFRMEHVYWGPQFTDDEIETVLRRQQLSYKRHDTLSLVQRTAACLASGKIVGWFQGAMEFGPRALGNRSILADPRDPAAKDRINARVKRRESFRPFAPSLPMENFGEFFGRSPNDPFMVTTYPVASDRRHKIPAALHVDGTGRPQSVDRRNNPRYWELLNEFGRLTGVPVLINTSFNEQEPIVCRPEEAVACFLRNEIDVLVLGSFIVERGL